MTDIDTTLFIKAVPGASGDSIAGWLDDALKIRVRAPAQRGRANAAIEKTLAAALGLRATSVQVVRGHTGARKTVRIRGLTADAVLARLPQRSPDACDSEPGPALEPK